MTSFQPVFPPDVLELSVKFQCSACRSVLHADARCEGREVLCPTCGIKIGIPRWSNVLSWPRTADGAEKARTKGPHASGITAPTLSMEEIDFLRGGGSSRKPEATS
jgi:DNA-directed RNA polymerase subunit RPC12/RpoP